MVVPLSCHSSADDMHVACSPLHRCEKFYNNRLLDNQKHSAVPISDGSQRCVINCMNE